MDYRLIAEKGEHALIQRGSKMQQYAVVSSLDRDKKEWNYTCSHYGFGAYAKLSEEEALFKALDDFRAWLERDYVSHGRLLEIAALLKDALVEDGADEAYKYMCKVMELSEKERLQPKTSGGMRREWVLRILSKWGEEYYGLWQALE